MIDQVPTRPGMKLLFEVEPDLVGLPDGEMLFQTRQRYQSGVGGTRLSDGPVQTQRIDFHKKRYCFDGTAIRYADRKTGMSVKHLTHDTDAERQGDDSQLAFRARSEKWEPVFGSNARQNKELERRSDSIRSQHALFSGRRSRRWPTRRVGGWDEGREVAKGRCGPRTHSPRPALRQGRAGGVVANPFAAIAPPYPSVAMTGRVGDSQRTRCRALSEALPSVSQPRRATSAALIPSSARP